MFDKKSQIVFLTACFCLAVAANAYDYDPNDFIVSIGDVNYVQGSGIGNDWISGEDFNKPTCVLGKPTVDTTGDGFAAPFWEPMPVVQVYPAFRAYELVTLGDGGHIIVKFNHPVRDDKNNPYGLDFIVFGNSSTVLDGSSNWYQQSDPNTVIITDSYSEPGVVSVSQDGITWYSFTDGPFADDFAPTLGRVYDPNNPDPNAFEGNLYWGEPTNPTIPIDPNLSYADFQNKSIAQICSLYYGQSAGGTGFDISDFNLPQDPNTGLKWIQYIKVEDCPGTSITEIDAFSDVASCGDWKHPFPIGDLNEDCRVDMIDFAMLAGNWLECTWNCQ